MRNQETGRIKDGDRTREARQLAKDLRAARRLKREGRS